MPLNYTSDIMALYATKIATDPNYQSPGNYGLTPGLAGTAGTTFSVGVSEAGLARSAPNQDRADAVITKTKATEHKAPEHKAAEHKAPEHKEHKDEHKAPEHKAADKAGHKDEGISHDLKDEEDKSKDKSKSKYMAESQGDDKIVDKHDWGKADAGDKIKEDKHDKAEDDHVRATPEVEAKSEEEAPTGVPYEVEQYGTSLSDNQKLLMLIEIVRSLLAECNNLGQVKEIHEILRKMQGAMKFGGKASFSKTALAQSALDSAMMYYSRNAKHSTFTV